MVFVATGSSTKSEQKPIIIMVIIKMKTPKSIEYNNAYLQIQSMENKFSFVDFYYEF